MTHARKTSRHKSILSAPRDVFLLPGKGYFSIMENPISIAFLYPAERDLGALIAINLEENKKRYIEPQIGYDSRATTVTDEDGDDSDLMCAPKLHLTFSEKPSGSHGFWIGLDPQCDVILKEEKLGKISKKHCFITFDKQRRLILRDSSTYGTIVTYDDRGRERRAHHTWCLSGKQASCASKIIIEIDRIRFQIVVSSHKNNTEEYYQNVDKFLRDIEENVSLGALGIYSNNSTTQHSGVQTPMDTVPVYIMRHRLGKGGFSSVYMAWDSSTEKVCAVKCINPGEKSEKNWKKEVDILMQAKRLQTVSFPYIFREIRLLIHTGTYYKDNPRR